MPVLGTLFRSRDFVKSETELSGDLSRLTWSSRQQDTSYLHRLTDWLRNPMRAQMYRAHQSHLWARGSAVKPGSS